MKRAGCCSVMLLASSMFIVTTPANSQSVVLDIDGTLGSSVFCCGANNAGNYPIPGLFGGTFSGTFEYDLSASPIAPPAIAASFNFTNLNIEVRNNVGALVYTIDNTVNQNDLRVFQDGSRVLLNFGQSAGLVGVPSDLRVALSGVFTTGNNPPPASEISSAPIEFFGPFPFLEIDDQIGGSWDLNIISVTISERPVLTTRSTWGQIKALYDQPR